VDVPVLVAAVAPPTPAVLVELRRMPISTSSNEPPGKGPAHAARARGTAATVR
jgi:hypothetical protein